MGFINNQHLFLPASKASLPAKSIAFAGKKKYVEILIPEDPNEPVEINKNVPAKKARGLYKLLWFYKAVPVLKPVFKRLFRSILPG